MSTVLLTALSWHLEGSLRFLWLRLLQPWRDGACCEGLPCCCAIWSAVIVPRERRGNKAMIMREGWREVGWGDGWEILDRGLLNWKRSLSINKWAGRQRGLITLKKRNGRKRWTEDNGSVVFKWKYTAWPEVCGHPSITPISDLVALNVRFL